MKRTLLLRFLSYLTVCVLAQGARQAQAEVNSVKAGDKKSYVEEAIKHYNRGVELHQSGFLNQAIAEYKGAIEADSRMEEAFSNLGVIYAAQRNYPRAREAFQTALSLKPNRPTTLNGLGTVLYAQGHIKEAKDKWRQVLAADPAFASAYYNLGNAFESEKNLDEALNDYASAIAAAPTMADAYYRMGNIYNKEHHSPQASVMLRRAIELSPDSDFVRESKRLLSSLEDEFSKGRNERHGASKLLGGEKTSLGTDGTSEASTKAKIDKKKSKSKDGIDVLLPPAEGEIKSDAKPTAVP